MHVKMQTFGFTKILHFFNYIYIDTNHQDKFSLNKNPTEIAITVSLSIDFMTQSDFTHLLNQQQLSSSTKVKQINHPKRLTISMWVVFIVTLICSLSCIFIGLIVNQLFWLFIFGIVLFNLTLWILDCCFKI